MKKTYRIKTNNQELLISKQNEFDATSRWIEFQKTRLLTSNTIWIISLIELISTEEMISGQSPIEIKPMENTCED